MKQYIHKPRKQHKLRRLVSNNKTGDAWGLTIPREIVEKYKLQNKFFSFKVQRNGDVLIHKKNDKTKKR